MLIDILIVLLIIGVVLWLINSFIPLDPVIKQIINVVTVVIVIIWLLMKLRGFA